MRSGDNFLLTRHRIETLRESLSKVRRSKQTTRWVAHRQHLADHRPLRGAPHWGLTLEKSVKAVAMITLMACCLGSATAQTTTSIGAPDCGQWVKQSNPSDRWWLLGHLSGMNVLHDLAGLKPANPLRTLSSADQAYLWMDNYCKANPLKSVDDGALSLFTELALQKLLLQPSKK